METRRFICPVCGDVKTFTQTEGMTRAEFLNRLPAKAPCSADGCEGYAVPEEEINNAGVDGASEGRSG